MYLYVDCTVLWSALAVVKCLVNKWKLNEIKSLNYKIKSQNNEKKNDSKIMKWESRYMT